MKPEKTTMMYTGQKLRNIIPQILPHGFESFGLTFWQTTGGVDLAEMAKKVKEILIGEDVIISCLSIFGNPLTGEGDNADSLASWKRLIDNWSIALLMSLSRGLKRSLVN